MGGCSSRDDRLKASFFTQSQFDALRKRFNQLSNESDGVPEKLIGPKGFEKMFGEDPNLARKIYSWIVYRSSQGIVDYQSFVLTAEILVGESSRLSELGSNRDYGLYQKSEILGLISFAPNEFQGKEFDKLLIDNLDVTYSQGINYIKEVILMFYKQDTVEHKKLKTNDIAAKLLTNGIFGNKTTLQFSTFFRLLSKPCPFISTIIRGYFLRKFLRVRDVGPRIPVIINESLIFDSSIIVALTMQNEYLRKYSYLQQQFSTKDQGLKFNLLKEELMKTTGPYFVFIRHAEEFDDVDEDTYSKCKDPNRIGKNLYVFGIFNSAKFTDMPVSGEDQSYIFSLIPRLQIFDAQKGAGGLTQISVTDKSSKVLQSGIGFGKSSIGSQHRVWLDQDLQNQSYIAPEDDIYEKGFILDPHISQLKIDLLELWVLTDSQVAEPVIEETLPVFEGKIQEYSEIRPVEESQVSCLLNIGNEVEDEDEMNNIIRKDRGDREVLKHSVPEVILLSHQLKSQESVAVEGEQEQQQDSEQQKVSCLLGFGNEVIEDEATILFREDRRQKENLPHIIMEQKRDIVQMEINNNRFTQIAQTNVARMSKSPDFRSSYQEQRNSVEQQLRTSNGEANNQQNSVSPGLRRSDNSQSNYFSPNARNTENKLNN